MKLTSNQRSTLERFRLGLPKSMRDWPGVPYNMLDMRSVPSLEALGLLESVMHERHSQSVGGVSRTPCFRLTDTGRAVLAAQMTE